MVQVAPDVSGLVTDVPVHDNQDVKAGDVLFEIDRARFQLAYDRAQASVRSQQVAREQALRDAKRNRALGQLVAAEALEQSQTKLQQTEAALAQAEVQLEQRAPEPGAQPRAGRHRRPRHQPGPARRRLRHRRSWRDGAGGFRLVLHRRLFRGNQAARIHEGDPVTVTLMGDDRRIHGHVESIALGIADRDRSTGANLLPNVNPTFNWVRLAQRIPVRVKIDQVPEGVRPVAGQTATVSVNPPETARDDGAPRHS